MDYQKLGNTGLEVSRICLGCMSFGDASNWVHSWLLNEDDSRPIIKQALDLGINFFDTANVYSLGRSEEILGKAIRDFACRDQVVLTTKVNGRMFKGPNGAGNSRKHILSQIDQSLNRLGTDYIDLYLLHRWDYDTPIEETMEVLHDLIKAGKVRYIGASAMYTWQFQKANALAKANGWTPFVVMQNHLNLLYREEEREMLPYCQDSNIAITPYSPLAAGRLVRELTQNTPRLQTDTIAMEKYDHTMETDRVIITRVAELAEKYELTKIQVALAWVLQKPQVVAPIVGATKAEHLQGAVDAVGITLSPEDIAYLEEPYVPHRVVGAL